MTTFITRFDTTGAGTRIAVKDLIDMEGVPTTAACAALADVASPATTDAPCLAGIRSSGARIVGRTNLHELAFGATGINPWYGTPVNPLDATRIPGGSSSGSAVAVATGEADVALGTDTAGSVRFPSACCGTTGLKTTYGRVPTGGVWPLAPSLDTVGPMARDVAGVTLGMQLLEPGFTPADAPARSVGRVRGLPADPAIDAAVDEALQAAGFEIVELEVPDWLEANEAALVILVAEAWASDRELFERAPDRIGADVAMLLQLGRDLPDEQVSAARDRGVVWRERVDELFQRVEVLALPTMPVFPPRLDEDASAVPRFNAAVNLAGLPALAQPVPASGHLPASLQLVAPHEREDLLVATGAVVEAAVAP